MKIVLFGMAIYFGSITNPIVMAENNAHGF